MAVAFFFILGVITIVLYINYIKSKRFRTLISKIPGPPALPLIGNGLQIAKTDGGPFYYFLDVQKKYGKVTKHWLGLGALTMYTMLSDPRDIEVLLKDAQNIRKAKNYDYMKPWLGEGLVTSTGNQWKIHRKIITPAFHFNILQGFVEVFNEKGKELVKTLEKKVGQVEFDIYPIIGSYALEAITETAMGLKHHGGDEEGFNYFQAIHKISEITHCRMFSLLQRYDFIFQHTKLGRKQNEMLNIIQRYCSKIMQQRKEELKNNPSQLIDVYDNIGKKQRFAFLDLLLKGQKDGSGFSDEDIREEVHTFMAAGFETTATALSFTVYYLAHNSEVQQKCFDEIQSLLEGSDRDCKLTDLQKLKYLDKVIKEVLRITPTVPFVTRSLDVDLQINGYTLPAGSTVGVFIYDLHRNPQIYPNPEKFDPERFNDDNTLDRHPYAYIPFSAGPRNCIGKKYAEWEIKAALVKILSHFRILPGEPIKKLVLGITLKSSNGIRVCLEKRSHLEDDQII